MLGLLRIRSWVLVLYLGLSLYVWTDFVRSPPDGLANLGLMLMTLPVALLGLLLGALTGSPEFVLLPDVFGYYGDHAVYYWPSVALTAAVLYWLGGKLGDRGGGRKNGR